MSEVRFYNFRHTATTTGALLVKPVASSRQPRYPAEPIEREPLFSIKEKPAGAGLILVARLYCGDTPCSRFCTGDWIDGLPIPVPQVESAGEQLVGWLWSVRNPLPKAPVPAPWLEPDVFLLLSLPLFGVPGLDDGDDSELGLPASAAKAGAESASKRAEAARAAENFAIRISPLWMLGLRLRAAFRVLPRQSFSYTSVIQLIENRTVVSSIRFLRCARAAQEKAPSKRGLSWEYQSTTLSRRRIHWFRHWLGVVVVVEQRHRSGRMGRRARFDTCNPPCFDPAMGSWRPRDDPPRKRPNIADEPWRRAPQKRNSLRGTTRLGSGLIV